MYREEIIFVLGLFFSSCSGEDEAAIQYSHRQVQFIVRDVCKLQRGLLGFVEVSICNLCLLDQLPVFLSEGLQQYVSLDNMSCREVDVRCCVSVCVNIGVFNVVQGLLLTGTVDYIYFCL